MLGPVNLSTHATDLADLRSVWDRDLKKSVRRRQRLECASGGFGFAAPIAYFDYSNLGLALCLVLLSIISLYGALKYMIGESNTNYLMHW
jgi:hypothetical protein